MKGPSGGQNGAGWRILIAGTGGQGVLMAARLLCDRFVELGHEVVSGQLHGMAQRGGAVQSCVIIDRGICPAIPSGQADHVLGFEPVETVRSLPSMSAETAVYMNTVPVIPFVLAQQALSKKNGAGYPDLEVLCDSIREVTSHLFTFDGSRCAAQAGSPQALNMVMLGCLLGTGSLPCDAEVFWEGAVGRIPVAFRATNTRAFLAGVEFAGQFHVSGRAS